METMSAASFLYYAPARARGSRTTSSEEGGRAGTEVVQVRQSQPGIEKLPKFGFEAAKIQAPKSLPRGKLSIHRASTCASDYCTTQ